MMLETSRVDLHDGTARVVVRASEEIRDPNDVLASYHRFFETLGSNPRMLTCDLHLPQRITITNQGTRWVAEATATVPR